MWSQIKSLPRAPLLLVVANALTMLGSGLTVFGLDVWIYRQTGSYEIFAMLAVLAALPALLFSPFAGVIVDRCSRRRLLIILELLSSIVILALIYCHWRDMLGPVAVGAATIALGMLGTVAWPASAAAITELTDSDDQRARINGLAETLGGIVMVSSPLLGGLIMVTWGIEVVLAADLASYLLCALLLACLRFPLLAVGGAGHAPAAEAAPVDEARDSVWREATYGFRWIAGQRHLLILLAFFATTNIGASVVSVALAPYLLSFNASAVLGTCLALLGAGTIAGGMAFAATGGFQRHEHGVLVGTLASALAMISLGVTRSPWSLAACTFIMGMCGPVINASSQTIWQSQVPASAQGRVFAVRRMIAWGLQPLSILLSIPLLAALFQPLLENGAAAVQLRAWWGSGQSGAIGLMISAFGLLSFVLAAVILARGDLSRSPVQAPDEALAVK